MRVTRGNHYCVSGDQRSSLLCEDDQRYSDLCEVEINTTLWGWGEVITTLWKVTRGYLYCVRGDQRLPLLCEIFSSEMAKIYCQILKFFFSRNTRPFFFFTNFGTKHLWVMGIQVCRAMSLSKGRWLLNSENVLPKLKSSSPEPLGQFQPHLAQNIHGWRDERF